MPHTPPRAYMPMGLPRPVSRDVSFENAPPALETLMRSCLPAPTPGENLGYAHIRFVEGVPKPMQDMAAKAADRPYVTHEEGFVIFAPDGCVDADVLATDADTICIYAETPKGFFTGGMALAHHLENGKLTPCLLWDYPLVGVRGVKVYIPPAHKIDEFKRVVDVMAYLRMNTLMMEIGGAMEYKRHPEVNEGWVDYCAKTKAYPTGTVGIQDYIYPWRKNSIHNENGGGGFLTQTQLAELIEYITARGIEIIPECPCTSHCDYMLTRHRELAEVPEDDYADTFCPSNPASYELLFDLLDEVIALFRPRTINIGHDEYYSVGVCPACRERDAVDIFAQDVNKIHGFLQSHGVRTMMWSDKIMRVTDGPGYGGAANFSYKAWDKNLPFFNIIPATWPAIHLVPKDILCLNWYWAHEEKYDEPYRQHGFNVVYGNFSATGLANWRQRRTHANILGGIVSNWSTADELYMQRNRIFFEMAYNHSLFWDELADNDQLARLTPRLFQTLYGWKNREVGEVSPNGRGKYLRVTHHTNIHIPYQIFHDGVYIDWPRHTLGEYRVTYADGTTANLPVLHGYNIGWEDEAWFPQSENGMVTVSSTLRELAYRTLPHRSGMKTWYTTVYDNPNPEKVFVSIKFIPNSDFHTAADQTLQEKEHGIYTATQSGQKNITPEVKTLGVEVCV